MHFKWTSELSPYGYSMARTQWKLKPAREKKESERVQVPQKDLG